MVDYHTTTARSRSLAVHRMHMRGALSHARRRTLSDGMRGFASRHVVDEQLLGHERSPRVDVHAVATSAMLFAEKDLAMGQGIRALAADCVSGGTLRHVRCVCA